MERDDKRSTRWSLLRALQDTRNEQAWQQFVAQYEPRIRSWCHKMGLRDHEADEITQSVLVSLVEKMKTFVYDPQKHFRGWLRTVVNNAVRNYWRQLQRRHGDIGSGDSDMQRTLEDLADKKESLGELMEVSLEEDMRIAQQVMETVRQQVKPRTWRVFVLTHVHGKKTTEVAAELGIKKTFVLVYKRRVIQMLRREASKYLVPVE